MQTAPEPFLPPARRVFWRALQGVFFGVGVVILAALFFAPDLGLHLLWNVLIPVAPALLVLAPGLWRNVCPMGTASLLPYHLRLSKGVQIDARWQGWMLVGAILLLIAIVPLRHVLLDYEGAVTGAVLLAVAVLAGGLGFVFSTKSAWCSGLCPVYPVEMLYGAKPVVTPRNSHCRTCTDCVSPCRDSRNEMTPPDATQRRLPRLIVLAFAGGFPGFIIGWYLVPGTGPRAVGDAYLWSLGGMAVSLAVFSVLAFAYPKALRGLSLLFAAAAVSAYYWFKLPVILGLGEPESAIVPGMDILPDWAGWPLRGIAILLFFVLLLRSAGKSRGWLTRPPKAA